MENFSLEICKFCLGAAFCLKSFSPRYCRFCFPFTSKSSNEDTIRKNPNRLHCQLSAKLFLNTQIPACLWFVSNKKHGFNGERNREKEILFIDAGELGHLINRRSKEFSDEDIAKVTDTYHQWRKKENNYQDQAGFCASVSLEKVKS